jgi:hypothetical protein
MSAVGPEDLKVVDADHKRQPSVVTDRIQGVVFSHKADRFPGLPGIIRMRKKSGALCKKKNGGQKQKSLARYDPHESSRT